MTYHKKDLKENILNEAYSLVNLKGYQNISLRMITRNLGVSPTAVYRHFKSYEDLLGCVVVKGEVLFSQYLLNNHNYEDDILDQLYTMAINYLNFSIDYPYLYDLIFTSPYTIVTSQEAIICEVNHQGIALLVDLINNAQLNTDTTIVLTQLWAYIQGYSYLVRFHNFNIEPKLIMYSIKSIMVPQPC